MVVVVAAVEFAEAAFAVETHLHAGRLADIPQLSVTATGIDLSIAEGDRIFDAP